MHAPAIALDRSWSRGPAVGQAPASWPARALAALARAYRLRRDTRELLRFSDAMLSDIGLSRGGVEGAVRAGRERS